MATSPTSHGQMRVRGPSVGSSGSIDRTEAKHRMESWIFVGFRLKSSEYVVIRMGEPITARTIGRRPVSERWANRPGRRQEAVVRHMGERHGRDHELDEATLPKPPAETGQSKSVYLKQSDFDAPGLIQGCSGCRAMREGIRAQGQSVVCRARMEELL